MSRPLLPPVLQALAWRLVDQDSVIKDGGLDRRGQAHAWVHRRMTAGPHGLPHQLAEDAWLRAVHLAPDPLQGLRLISSAVLHIEQGVPRVADEEAWDSVCRIVDPELIALAHPDLLARACESGLRQRGLYWSPILRAQHTVFHRVCDGPLAEVHAHLGGSLPTCVLWILLVSGMLSPEILRSMHAGAGWDTLILAARNCYSGLLPDKETALTTRLSRGVEFDGDMDVSRWPLAEATIDGSATLGLLVPDRLLLLRHLRQALAHEAGDCSERFDSLFHLIALRNAFNARLSQPPGHRGLVEFQGFYDRRSTLWSNRARGDSRRRIAGPVQVLGFELLLESWLADRDGNRDAPLDLELRTQIPLRNREPRDFLLSLSRALSRVIRRHRVMQLRVGIVHHTIKSQRAISGETAQREFEQLWSLLEEVPQFRHLLVGVDAASNELICPPRSFSGAFQWLRHRQDHASHLQDPPIRLGFTFHAGEDFRDLLTGIRHVDEAAHLLGMRAGDRLGHALALFWPVEDFYVVREHAFPTVADHVLDLIWAAALLYRHEGHGDLERAAQGRLHEILSEIGAQPEQNVISIIRALDIDGPHPWASPRARTLRHTPLSPDLPARALREDELLCLMGISPDIGMEMARRPQKPLEWQRLVAACQRLVQARILDRGLVIEINPSSNRIVGGFRSPSRLPYTRVSKPGPREPGQMANIPLAIGTDDAGIFHTSLRREYELVGQAALSQGYALPDVHAWLDDIRRTGVLSSFLAPNGPRGCELLKVLDELVGNRKSGE